MSANNTYSYTIQNDDVAPSLAFTASTGSGDESVTLVNVSLELSAPSSKDVTLYTVARASAVNQPWNLMARMITCWMTMEKLI